MKHFLITRCQPLKGRQCIPNVVFKNEGSMVPACRKINVHVVNTDICMLKSTRVFMENMRKQTHQCAKYKLKIVYKT